MKSNSSIANFASFTGPFQTEPNAFKGYGNNRTNLSNFFFEHVAKIRQEHSPQANLIRRIESNPKDAKAYLQLGLLLPLICTVYIHKKNRNAQELFLKAIELDPNYSRAYHNLARTLQPGGTIELPDRTVKNQQQLYLKAIELDPNFAGTYHNLARTLQP
jgi:tetratricopeptide (TPR) repeat protein